MKKVLSLSLALLLTPHILQAPGDQNRRQHLGSLRRLYRRSRDPVPGGFYSQILRDGVRLGLCSVLAYTWG